MSRLSLFLLGFLAPAIGLLAQAPTRTTEIPDQTLNSGDAATVDLKGHFGVTGFPNTPIALFETPLGNFYVELLTTAAPKHVENFTKYANEGLYDTSFFHRSSSLKIDQTQQLPDITADSRVIQGGGFRVLPTGFGDSVRVPVPQKAVVNLEYSQPNARGTLAAARGSAANSATSQWFFNLTDNSTDLGQVNGTGGYSVFGRVIGSGMEVVDALGKLKRYRYSENFTEFPLYNYTSGPVLDENLALINRVRVVETYPADVSTPGLLRFEATSSAPDIVGAKINGSTLVLTPGKGGTATVTVDAYDAADEAVSWTFDVTVNAPRIITPPQSSTVAPGGSVTFTVVAEGSELTYQWRRNGTAIGGATAASLTLTGLSAEDAGEYTVAVSQGSGTTISRPATLLVQPPGPSSLANLSVRANSSPTIIGFVVAGEPRPLLIRGAGPTLQASFALPDGMPDPKVTVLKREADGTNTLIGANDNWDTVANEVLPIFTQVGAFPFASATSHDAAVHVTMSGIGSAVIEPKTGRDGIMLGEIYDVTPGAPGGLSNISARTWVGTGDDVVIIGFTISGNQPRRVLIRAVGPTLASIADFYGTLPDPTLTVHRKGSTDVLIAQNDDWGTEPEVAAVPLPGAFPLDPGSKDAALVLSLPTGAYTATVRGLGSQWGVALVELYDLD